MKQAKFLSTTNLLLCAGLLSAAVLTGCGKEEITVYTAPKDIATKPSFAAADSKHAEIAEASAAPVKAPLTWKTPANWEQLAPTSMRVGNFSITEGEKPAERTAEVTIIPIPGSIGGELENVNRWRGEIGLNPINDGEYTSEPVAVGSDSAKLYTLIGEQKATVAAWLEKEGVQWFFKMRGDKDLVTKNKPTLIEFLKSIEFSDPAEEQETAKVETAPNDQAEKAAPSEAEEDGPKWQVPAHWKEGPKKQMVDKNWDVAADGDKKANVAISSFAGDAGGLVANVNRWRGQLSLPAMNEQEVRAIIKTLETSDGQTEAQYVDLTGKDRSGQPSRMIAAVVPHGGFTWYYKILGNGDVVEKEKTAFLKMVQTARYQ